MVAFIFINDMDEIVGDFYIKFFVRASCDGKMILYKGEFLKFKYNRYETKSAILYVAIFLISWIFLELA